jgi:hypothetical protein
MFINIKIKMGKRKEFNKNDIEKILKLYNENFESTNNIALMFSVDPSVIISRLKNLGVIIPKGSAYSKQYWIQRGLNEDKIENHIRTLRPVNIEYWVKNGYTEEEAILQIEGQKMVSLRGCIARFGEEEGKKIWYERETKRSEAGKKGSAGLKYWLDKGYSEDEAKKLRSERQSTFSLEKCIKKYGKEEGKKRFTERQTKWSKSLSSGGNIKIGYSKISQELFYFLLENYSINDRDKIFFGSHNNEFKLEKKDGGLWLYDFTDTINKKIIEFNGDMYHGNPKKYKSNDTPHPFRKNITAQDMWDNDKEKIMVANANGFEVLTIWDSEYRWGNKQKIINKCKKFLNKK